jgi:PAS domain S-box-containing protein
MVKTKQDRLSRTPEVVILCISILIVVAIGSLSYINAKRAQATSEELGMTRAVLTLNGELLSALKDAETGQRGFLLTGQQQFLEPYNQALSVIPEQLKRLELLVQRSPDQRAQMKAIEPLVAAKLLELRQTIELSRSNKRDVAQTIVNGGTGKTMMDDIRARRNTLDQVAEQRLASFTASAKISSSRLQIVGTLGSAVLFGFLVTLAMTLFRSLNVRDELLNQAHASERKLAVTLSSIADGVISTDATARIIFLNPAAEQLTGWTQQECVGHHISEVFRIVNETTRDTVVNPLEQAMIIGKAVGLANHTKLIVRDGTEIFIDDSAAPIFGEIGELVGGVLVFRNISERRQAEHELAQSALALQRSNDELQQFAFAASHDLRSPLRSVNSMAQLIAKRFGDKLGKEGGEMISYITAGANSMARLVEDLLTLANASHIDRDAAHMVCVQGAFDAARNNLMAEVQATGATITSAPLPFLAVRDTHLILMFQNILSNSLKYCGPLPPKIHVSAEQNGAEWIISVTDNGIGIDPRYTEQIFQPFKRLHGPEYEGSGIGLSTCKKIVTGYGGRIWVESQVGKGSTFLFSLPATVAKADAAAHGA